jgi:hypothetical protein
VDEDDERPVGRTGLGHGERDAAEVDAAGLDHADGR